MGIKRTEFFADENGIEKRRDIYDNGMEIIQEANPPEQEHYQPTEQEITQAKLDYLLMMRETLSE